jgi:hypothetical protein
MKQVPTNEKVQIKWFVYSMGEKFPKQSRMQGFNAFDAACSCGWESRTGGAIYRCVKEEVELHKAIAHNYEWESTLQSTVAKLEAKFGIKFDLDQAGA